jgi:uncharacterized protein (DUF2235 family)
MLMTNDTTHEPKRQLVICSDGTNNNLTGGVNDTNVVKLMQLIDEGQDQLLFYDPGVGHPGELPGATGWDRLSRSWERVAGLAFGRGVYENVAEAYIFLMQNYRVGDELYFFGFSRGAFTVRCIAGLVNQFGVLDRQMTSMVPTLLNVYFSQRRGDAKFQSIVDQIRVRFSVTASTSEAIHFVGVWDSVASVGVPPFTAKMTASPTIQGADKRFRHVRQALALDEHRAAFKPRVYHDQNGSHSNALGGHATMKQLWFNGAHCDVGGGYGDSSTTLSDKVIMWFAEEARSCGLRLSANGKRLTSQAEIVQALARAVAPHRAAPIVHSETYSMCLWAIAGLRVRDPTVHQDSDTKHASPTPEMHASVVEHRLTFEKNTEWGMPPPVPMQGIGTRQPLWLGIMLATAMIAFLLMGALQSGGIEPASWESVLKYCRGNSDFTRWQLGGWHNPASGFGALPFAQPLRALALDLLFIAAYSYALAWFVVLSFARLAGVGDGRPRSVKWLNRFGMALPVMVVFDLAENFFSAVVIFFHGHLPDYVLGALACLMSFAALTKFIALSGVLTLIGWGVLHRPKP